MNDPGGQLRAALANRYRIERELGSGGMATVYLAHDERHGRDVAVKVLHPELAAALGAERFLSEIKTTARLQHPHILPLLDSGEADGFLFYVMPFVAGETLRARLERERQVPIDDALRIAREVADALGAAHALGIIHRDIKPENILLQGGHALVADFGIALAVQTAGGQRMTQTGLSLGTPQYMSPEQAMGEKKIDARSDIYALGAVVYEMLAGEPPFAGPTLQTIVARVMSEEPRALRAQRKSVPESVEQAVLQALEKLPADRQGSAAEFASALDGSIRGRRRTPTYASPAGQRSPGALLGWGIAVLAVAVSAWSLTRLTASPSADVQPLFASIQPPPNEVRRGGAAFAISPDGRRIAVIASGPDDGWSIFVRSLDVLVYTKLEGTDGASSIFWSPDGASLGFFAGGQLRVVDVASSTVRTLCSAPRPGGGTWGVHGDILFNAADGLMRVSSAGGACTSMHLKQFVVANETRPRFLPDGEYFIATSQDKVWLGRLGEDTVSLLGESVATSPVFAAPDYLLIRAAGDATEGEGLYAQRIDVRARRLVGQRQRLLDRVTNQNGDPSVSASSNGVMLALGPGMTPRRTLTLVRRDGAVLDSATAPLGSFMMVRLSHDGTRLALGGWGLWVHDLQRGVTTKLESFLDTLRQTSTDPVWAPEDTLIAVSRTFNRFGVNVVDPRSGEVRSLFETPVASRTVHAWDWSRDGRYLIYSLGAGDGAAREEAWMYDVATKTSQRLFDEPGNASQLQLSADGRWIAYASDQTGANEVFLRPFPREGVPVRVSKAGGTTPHWRHDGRELFYRTSNDKVMAVSVQGAGATLTIGEPRLATPLTLDRASKLESYDVSPDGQRFILSVTIGEASELILILNWWKLVERPQ